MAPPGTLRLREGVSMVALAGAMVLHSVCLSLERPASALASLWSDHFAVQNLGHAAFLCTFMFSYWHHGSMLGAYMCLYSAGLLLATCGALASVSARALPLA
eukprot:CAMPEP_0119495670 /NCGR_PEP_ID=MMETSP1344-20130328/19225_1 /TAXON_ID=236787 /ORGANISM="Florenciella parvula, Strain CCMP2471" /LENGTH=101 /DNA_ID=CAMNT_0007531271 /DNA_START=64 /DNA_END=365 /DNA_ORIENTATION=-